MCLQGQLHLHNDTDQPELHSEFLFCSSLLCTPGRQLRKPGGSKCIILWRSPEAGVPLGNSRSLSQARRKLHIRVSSWVTHTQLLDMLWVQYKVFIISSHLGQRHSTALFLNFCGMKIPVQPNLPIHACVFIIWSSVFLWYCYNNTWIHSIISSLTWRNTSNFFLWCAFVSPKSVC